MLCLAADVGEAAADLDHQVAGDELERRVRRVDRPGPDLGTWRPLMTRVPGVMVTASAMSLFLRYGLGWEHQCLV